MLLEAWLLHGGLQPGPAADTARESTKAEAKQELLQCLALHTHLDFPLHSLPTPHGTIQQYLPGPDSLFPDYLVVVVVGNEKRKMFIFPKQRGT